MLGVDASTDLAALKVDADAAKGVKPLQFADSDKVQVGDSAIAIGYPLGLDRTATAGIISGLERKIESPNGFSIDKVIQTDAPINPGNSGGPLLNANGQVIGVNSQIATAGGGQGSVGIGFAVPASIVQDVLPQLARGVAPEHAYLGLTTSDAPNGGAQIAQATSAAPPRRPASRRATSSRGSTARRSRRPTTSPGDRGQEARRPGRCDGAARRIRADRAGHARPASGDRPVSAAWPDPGWGPPAPPLQDRVAPPTPHDPRTTAFPFGFCGARLQPHPAESGGAPSGVFAPPYLPLLLAA